MLLVGVAFDWPIFSLIVSACSVVALSACFLLRVLPLKRCSFVIIGGIRFFPPRCAEVFGSWVPRRSNVGLCCSIDFH